MNGFLIDTNALVERIKGNEIDLLRTINENLDNYNFYIPSNVFEEIHFILIKEFSGLSYWKLKKKKEIVKEIFSKKVSLFWRYFLSNFKILPIDEEILKLGEKYIEIYGLLPNDALVLATCKNHSIKYLISIDREDFTIPCEKERIVLIDSAEKLKEVLNK